MSGGGDPALTARLQQLLGAGQTAQALTLLDGLPLMAQDAGVAYLHAMVAARCGQRARADAALAHCLAQWPGHPGALFLRAVHALDDGDRSNALEGFEATVRAAPGWAEAHYNLGVAQAALGRSAEAEQSYRSALRLNPMLVQAANNLANLLCERGALTDAVSLMRTAVSAAPGFAIGWCTLGRSLFRLRQLEPAVEALKRSLALDPTQAAAWENLGEALHLLEETSAAADAFARALALDPESLSLAFKLDTLRGAQPPRPPDDFVSRLFDAMAGDFDAWLVERLDYRLPQQLSHYLPAGDGLDVLDLGCGTGLAGSALRPLARRLEGADLSPKMLEKAAARGLYDALHETSLQTLLARETQSWDLLLATDVFIYVGALEEVFELAGSALRPGGWLLFSIELLARDGTEGFRLQPSGRYAHAVGYLYGLASKHGFEVELDEAIDLRRERAAMLTGRVLRLRRS
ncbi:MAG: tetratricopeptide repeat protein [Aquimonas sp.]